LALPMSAVERGVKREHWQSPHRPKPSGPK
jgi:hypothetical protein